MKLKFEINQENLHTSLQEVLDVVRNSNVMTYIPNAKLKIEISNENE